VITIYDLQKELPEEEYEALTQGDDTIAERALTKAKIWLLSQFKKFGQSVDFEDEIVREAWLKRALYELFSYVGKEEAAIERKEDAKALLTGILGAQVVKGEGATVAVKIQPGEPTTLARLFRESQG